MARLEDLDPGDHMVPGPFHLKHTVYIATLQVLCPIYLLTLVLLK
jgi:hypothetical protein